jgi:hypothetical protein
MLTRLDQLLESQGKLMPRHGRYWIGIQPSTTHHAIGGIAHHCIKGSGWEEMGYLTGIGAQDSQSGRKAILHNILSGCSHKRFLQFESDDCGMRKASCQHQGDDATASTNIEA